MKYNYFLLLFVFLSVHVMNSQIEFENQATALGINVATGNTYLGNGVSFYDFDNDGWDDITLTTADTDEVRFFKNINGSFVEQNFSLPFLNYETKSVTWVDFDNDGDSDLFVTSETVGNKLIENLGNMTFQDISATSGIATNNMSTYGASWGDYNNDGFLDVFLSNRTFVVPNKLYKNEGGGSFTDVTLQAGIDQTALFSFCSAFLDINNDGLQDIYVSNDKLNFKNKLYKNNGDGTFDDISVSSGTDIGIDAMSVTVGDYNTDGYFDIYVTNSQGGNHLLRNNGDETFTNVANATGTEANSVCWGAVFFDADNNMDLDLYVSSEFDGSFGDFLPAAFYQNNGNTTFLLNNSCFPGDTRESYSNAVGDIDNDGLMDLVVTNRDDKDVFLWKNNTIIDSNWIKLNLTGTLSNRDAIGTRIEISINGEKQYGYTHCGEGYLSQNSKVEHFGLSDHTIIDYIKLTWQSGLVENFFNVQSNQTLNITEGTTLGLEGVSEDKFYMYPNPSNGILNIHSSTGIQQVDIYNLLGQHVMKYTEVNNNQIDISQLKVGQYYVSVTSGNSVSTKKLIKR